MTNIKVAILISAALILMIASVWNDSPIVDEIPHIGAGYSYVTKGDYRLNPEHPPLPKDLAGLAMVPLDLNHSAFTTKFWTTDINGQWDFGRNLIFNSGNDAIAIAKAAKAPMFIFFILSAVLIFIWTKKLDGNKAGLLALFLFAFSPTVMAHSRFVTTDVPALFGILSATYFFIKYLKNPTRKNLFIAGIVFGVAQLTKFSLFLLVPYLGLLALIYGWLHGNGYRFKNSIKFGFMSVLVMIMGYTLVVWPIYGLHTMNYPPERQKNDTMYLLGSFGNRTLADTVVALSDKPVIRPLAQYGVGLLMVTQRSVGGNKTYFLGEVRSQAWKKYFPIVYLIKEPLPFWGLIIIALAFIAARLKASRGKATDWIKNNFDKFAMLVWLAVYWYTSIRANLNIGVRHLMPVYGFTYILLSGAVMSAYHYYTHQAKKILTLLLAILLGWYLVENIRVYPFYLSYFNQLAGGPSGGYKIVADSNLDWGQDAKRLADWLRENNIQEKVHLDYFGWTDPSYYYQNKYLYLYAGKYKSLKEFLNENPQGGWIAISATFYMGSRERPDTSYEWLDPIKPVTVMGNSIFVWHITP